MDDPIDGFPLPRAVLVTHPTTHEEASTVCARLYRSVRLYGLVKRPELNGQWGKTLRFDVQRERFQVRLDFSGNVIWVKPNNFAIITRHMADTDEKRKQEREEHNAEVHSKPPPPLPPQQKRKSKKLQSRGGSHPHICKCCNKPMELCEDMEMEQVKVSCGPDMIEFLASDEIPYYDGGQLTMMTKTVTQDCYDYGYHTINGCECNSWRYCPLSYRWPDSREGCWHLGNNPLQPPLPQYHEAGIANAMLNLAWRDDDDTRFAAVERFMALIVTAPPPEFIMSEEFFYAQLQLFMTLCSGKSECSKAAAYTVQFVYICAINSRPVDYDIPFFKSECVDPIQDMVKRGSYRRQFEARDSIFQRLPRGLTFAQFHDRRSQIKMVCDGCGKQQQEAPIALRACTACRQVFYCSKTCQVQHWKKAHKKVCPKLAKLNDKNKELAWKPAMTKRVCRRCGFGPASKKDMSQHGDLTGHNPMGDHQSIFDLDTVRHA